MWQCKQVRFALQCPHSRLILTISRDVGPQPKRVRLKRKKCAGEEKQETLTLAVGLWPRTRIAKVFALRLVAVRILLRCIGRWQAIGEAGDRGQALLVQSRGRRSHGNGCREEASLSEINVWLKGRSSSQCQRALPEGQVRSKQRRGFAVVRTTEEYAQRCRLPAEATEAREPGRNFAMALGRRGRVHLEIGE
jgi:hypothetical protein